MCKYKYVSYTITYKPTRTIIIYLYVYMCLYNETIATRDMKCFRNCRLLQEDRAITFWSVFLCQLVAGNAATVAPTVLGNSVATAVWSRARWLLCVNLDQPGQFCHVSPANWLGGNIDVVSFLFGSNWFLTRRTLN